MEGDAARRTGPAAIRSLRRPASVDARGCWVLSDLLFATDSSAIDSMYEEQLADIVAVLKQNSDVRVRVDGFTDAVGPEGYNQRLSERRALEVRSSLVSAGIDSERVGHRGWGEAKPAAGNDTEEGRRSNRRIELTVIR